MVQVQSFGTGTRNGLETLHKCGISVETKSQKALRANSYDCRSYRGPFLVKKSGRRPFYPPSILNRVND